MVSITDLLEQNDKSKEPLPLTKAEKKKLKKQQKKLEQEAKLRKAQEDDMSREINVAKKNIRYFRTKWKEMQMEKARPEYKEYMMEHWCLFDHLMDKKDKLIELLEHELAMTERTRLTSVMDHVDTVDKTLLDYNNILDQIRSEMLLSKNNLMCERDKNMEAFNQDASYVDENMRLVLFLLDLKKKEDYAEWNGQFVTIKDEENMLNRSEHELLIARMEVKLMNLWNDYKDNLEDYLDYSKRILKHSDVLKVKMEAGEQLIMNQKSKLTVLMRMIDAYRLEAIEPISVELRDLRIERYQLYAAYTEEKKRLEDVKNENYRRISHLINSNQEINLHFQRLLKRGQHILKLFDSCKKLETGKEQYTKEMINMKYHCSDHSTGNKMLKFWNRVSHADKVTRLLYVQKRHLLRSNKFLNDKLAQVLQGGQLQQVLRDITHCSQGLFQKKHMSFKK